MHRESPFLFINNLTFHNFKRLQRSDISMANLMILVGPNGGGKSSIISAFDFFTTFFNAKYNSIAEFENKFKTFNFIDFYSRNPDGEKTFSIGFQINSNDKIFKEKAFQISFNFYNYERGIQLESVKLIFYNMFSFNIILKENESVLLDMDPNSLSFDYLKSDLVDEYSGDGILVDTPGPPHEDMYKRIKVNVEDSKESKNITDVIAYSLGIILPETLEKLKSNFFYGVFAEDREEFYNDLANWISKASFKEGINYYSDIILDSIDYLEDIYFYFIEGLRVISETFINISIIDDVRKTPSE
ncbi:MAG: AAA family ATPase, partial [Ignavibacteriae bacterium]|nr:AAA family ATPase [Ignavibacteriota bacterium]